MILRRVEITLYGPDDYPEDHEEYEEWHRKERQAIFLFMDYVRICAQQLRQNLPEEYEIETLG